MVSSHSDQCQLSQVNHVIYGEYVVSLHCRFAGPEVLDVRPAVHLSTLPVH